MKTTASIKRENLLGYLSLDIICSLMLTVFPQARLLENCWNKYLSIFPCQMEAIVYLFYSYLFPRVQLIPRGGVFLAVAVITVEPNIHLFKKECKQVERVNKNQNLPFHLICMSNR